MYKVGITGGIGSGKTSACMVFETLGIPVYYADTRAKQLMNTDAELKSELEGYFGKGIYGDGTLNRRRLAEIVFSDPIALEKLNCWVHPAVARDFECWCTLQTSRYVLEEAAIIFESGLAQRFDQVILVTAPEHIRIRRVCARDHSSPETVRKRMDNQWREEKKIALADFIIHNDNEHAIIPQVMKIHQDILSNLF
jgi:dephospho-CoA kinase